MNKPLPTVARLYLADLLHQAADACSHGWAYPLDSVAAEQCGDPRSGQGGYRCIECGSVLCSDPVDRRAGVIHPCELRPHAIAEGRSHG